MQMTGHYSVWPLAHTELIYEDDGSALFGAVFFSVGHRFVYQWRMACSSRLMARPLGRWQEKFSPLSSRHTPNSEYRLPLIFSMSLPTRESVHRSVAYPCTKAPASSATTTASSQRRSVAAGATGAVLAQGAPAVRIKRLSPPPHRRAAHLEPPRHLRRLGTTLQ